MDWLEHLMNKSKQTAIHKGADFMVAYLQRDPVKHIDSVLNILSSLDALFGNKGRMRAFMDWINANPGSRQWFTRVMTRNQGQVGTFVRNFLGNSCLKWMELSDEIIDKYGFCPPYNILISPTMRCNLKCQGCYAQGFTTEEELEESVMEKIITEGKSLGVFFYTILGGEPFLRFDDLERLALRHSDCLFQVFTNGTLFDHDTARRLAEIKNVLPVFSIGGSCEETEHARGRGVYEKVLDAMGLLRRHDLIFGISLTLTAHNFATFMSADFLKFWQDQGVLFGWNFLFMPVGMRPDLSLMPSPEQRAGFGEFIKAYREHEPLFFMDFFSDAPALGGCIAAGRRFLHINARGDVEPCIFAHFATHNIGQCSLIEALQSPFFTFIRMQQPHTDNLLRPCMIIDNPGVLREACRRFSARPTEPGAEALISDPDFMQAIDRYAAQTAQAIDPLWQSKYHDKIASMSMRRRSYAEGIDRIAYLYERLDVLERIKHWAHANTVFAHAMLDGLEFAKHEWSALRRPGRTNKHSALAPEREEEIPV